MPRDFIPLHRGNYRGWLQNLKSQAIEYGPNIGASTADVASVVALTESQMALMAATDAAKTALKVARTLEREGRLAANQALRRKMRQWKQMDGFGPVQALALRVTSKAKPLDPLTYKPRFTVRVIPGGIRLDWKKRGADGVFVYCRIAGTSAWIKIGVDTVSPYLDARPLATPGVPETREYMLRGMVNDAVIGLDSSIVSVTWNGQ